MNPKITITIVLFFYFLIMILMLFFTKFLFVGFTIIGVLSLVMYNLLQRIKGYNAFLADVPFNKNPNVKGLNEEYEWSIGWKMAKRNQEKEMRRLRNED